MQKPRAFFRIGAAVLASVQSGSTAAWQVALGVVFIAGVLFLLLTLIGVREKLLEAISPSMRNAIAIGIGNNDDGLVAVRCATRNPIGSFHAPHHVGRAHARA